MTPLVQVSDPSPLDSTTGINGTVFLNSEVEPQIAVDPTNSSKVYLGTAQGGVWRSLDGGTTWAAIFDGPNVLSQAIGALALARHAGKDFRLGGQVAGFFAEQLRELGHARAHKAGSPAYTRAAHAVLRTEPLDETSKR